MEEKQGKIKTFTNNVKKGGRRMKTVIKIGAAALGLAAVSVVGLAIIGSKEDDVDAIDADFSEIEIVETEETEVNEEQPEVADDGSPEEE